jgi:pyruvate kinase
VQLKKGQKLEITTNYEFLGNSRKISCSYKGLPKSTEVGGTVLMADSAITCRTTQVGADFIEVEVLNDAVLGEKKNMALPGKVLDMPTVAPKDEDDIINFGLKYQVDMIALSFTRYGSDITGLRKLMGERGKHIMIIPKIENH